MILYEIRNNKAGESYCRRYAWAEDSHQLQQMIERIGDPTYKWESLSISFILDSNTEPFITKESDTGFGEKQPFQEIRRLRNCPFCNCAMFFMKNPSGYQLFGHHSESCIFSHLPDPFYIFPTQEDAIKQWGVED
ncbi:MAG: hypothetical protein PHN44_01890 [Candidatus Marinimicrobia bacterium]|jgi:hypothetical protein|nr:hypothetical protein [Candidatus Neomarinimicrobiota bacterium]